MSTNPPDAPEFGIEVVAAEFPDWDIEPSWSPYGWIAHRQLSPTATHTVAGRSATDLQERLRKAVRRDA
jgi:hypothetical protein